MSKRRPPFFQQPRRIELAYEGDIAALIDPLMKKPAIRAGATAGEAFTSARARLDFIDAMSERIARRMVTAVAEGNARSWRVAAAKSTKGRQIYDALRHELDGPVGVHLQERIREEALRIRSIPQDVAQELQEMIAVRQLRGQRAEQIVEELRSHVPTLTHAKIQMIARTGTASAATSLTRVRASNLNLNWYEWDTSEDAIVRASHRLMDLVLINWSDPPAPEALAGIRSTLGHYHAGQCPNCRCDANVLVSLDQISWPHKVYTGNRIVRMTRAAFVKLSGMAA